MFLFLDLTGVEGDLRGPLARDKTVVGRQEALTHPEIFGFLPCQGMIQFNDLAMPEAA